MPEIRASTDLRSDYRRIIDCGKEINKPVFITKDWHGDVVILGMESHDNLCAVNVNFID